MHTRLTVWACAILATGIVASLAPRVEAQCQYEVTVFQPNIDCDPFPDSPTVGYAINETSQIAGGYTVCGLGAKEAFFGMADLKSSRSSVHPVSAVRPLGTSTMPD